VFVKFTNNIGTYKKPPKNFIGGFLLLRK